MDQEKLENTREDYTAATLSEASTKADPIKQFEIWFDEAQEAKVPERNAMTLSTATTNGVPSARIVLLKGVYNGGFSFYTNYLSRKGKEITKNPVCALTFFWPSMERQVRIEGTIEKLTKEQSEKYFHSRPKNSQIGAVASPQSQEIESRDFLEKKWEELTAEFADKDVPKPSFWGGYIVKPRLIEFWQGRQSRLHDRIVLQKDRRKKLEKSSFSAMMLEEVKSLLVEKFGAKVIAGEETGGLQPALLIKPDKIADVCLELRNNAATYFDFLSSITGVDYGVEANRFGAVYHLASIPYQTQLTLKISIENDRDLNNLPSFPSVTSVYRTADWHERETYDLLGIFFENHPDLRRILLPDDWEGFPLRKDYKNAEYYKGIKID